MLPVVPAIMITAYGMFTKPIDFPRFATRSQKRVERGIGANGAEGRHWAGDQGRDGRHPRPNQLELEREIPAGFLTPF